eukprot:6182940-Pleurochrysis_carterae.AAC.1
MIPTKSFNPYTRPLVYTTSRPPTSHGEQESWRRPYSLATKALGEHVFDGATAQRDGALHASTRMHGTEHAGARFDPVKERAEAKSGALLRGGRRSCARRDALNCVLPSTRTALPQPPRP